MSPQDDDDNDDVVLTGEYALHLLSPAERSSLEARLGREPALRTLLAEWQEGLAPLAASVASVVPPPALKARVEEMLFGPPERAPGFWSQIRVWRTLTAAALASAAVLALLLVVEPPRPPSGPALVSEVEAPDDSLRLVALFDDEADVLEINRVAGQALADRVLELWLIAGEDAPVSLGVLPDEPRARVEIPDALRLLLPGATLAISDEPPGGSPTGAPTGDILATGVVSEV